MAIFFVRLGPGTLTYARSAEVRVPTVSASQLVRFEHICHLRRGGLATVFAGGAVLPLALRTVRVARPSSSFFVDGRAFRGVFAGAFLETPFQ
jgi:hypothetical protein